MRKRRIVALLAVGATLALGGVSMSSAGASVPSENAHNCQGSDVSIYAPAHVPFGSVVSGFAQDGVLVGFVHSAANCGNNNH